MEQFLSFAVLNILQNSANIIVQNRMTGQLEEEKMQVYVRLGIRLLYKVGDLMFSSLFVLKLIYFRGQQAEWRAHEASILMLNKRNTVNSVVF